MRSRSSAPPRARSKPSSGDRAFFFELFVLAAGDAAVVELLHQGQPIPDWHPLNTGDPDSTHKTGNSVRGLTVPEFEVHEDDWDDYIIDEKP